MPTSMQVLCYNNTGFETNDLLCRGMLLLSVLLPQSQNRDRQVYPIEFLR